MVVVRLRQEDMMWNYSAQRLVAWQIHLLHLLRLGRARTPGVLLLLHVAGELWPSASPSDAALLRASGDLRPPRRDVRGRANVGAPILALLCAASLQVEHSLPQSLLLLAQEQGLSYIHRPPHPPQVGPLEGRLGDCAG
jgi:hypothetical protein